MTTRPQTWVDWADFLSKTVIAVAALVVTVGVAVVTHGEEQRSAAQKALADSQANAVAQKANSRAEEANSREASDFILKYIPEGERDRMQLQLAVRYCNDRDLAGTKSAANVDLCRGVSELGTKRLEAIAPSAAAAANSAVTHQDPKAFLNSRSAATQNAGLAASEAGVPSQLNRWFAVVGTLPQSSSDAVHSLAEQLNSRLLGAGLPKNDVHVYRTQISKSFALTSGLDKTEAEARARARMLREAGFADAFAQPDRGWVKADELR
jgi:hypothetical protein